MAFDFDYYLIDEVTAVGDPHFRQKCEIALLEKRNQKAGFIVVSHQMDIVRKFCSSAVVLTHEGGYSSAYVPFCGLAIVEELSGIRTAIVDPIMPAYAGAGGQALQPHQDDAVRTAETLLVGLS